jgi:uncharacterized delta-60 repeat protein
VVAGSYHKGNWWEDTVDFALARFRSDGSLDLSFDGDGKVTTGLGGWDEAYALAIQDDGGIVAAGSAGSDFGLARYNRDGTLDTSLDRDGKLTTGLGGYDTALAVAIQDDDRIVVAGRGGDDGDFALARYNPGGTLDTAFDRDGKLTTDFGSFRDQASGVAVQTDGKIVAVGRYGTSEFALARYNRSGSPDISFAGDGRLVTDFGRYDVASGVAIQSDGKIVAAGTSRASEGGGEGDFALARYHAFSG